MELGRDVKGTTGDRRWAGAFRVCAACGRRNWVGQRRCRACDALLVGVRAVSRPPAAMIGRRSADQVLTPRIRAIAIGAFLVAMVGGVVLLKVFRTDGFQDRVVPAASAMTAPPLEPMAEAPDPPPPMDVTQALRAAERGRRLLDAGQVKSALQLLADAVRTLPENAELAHTYGAALWKFEARDRALFQFQRAQKLSPDNAVYREDLARALSAMGRTAEAAHLLQGPAVLAAGTLSPAEALQPGAGEAVNLGGAGRGSYKGRRAFTDADLQRAHVEVAAPAPTPPTPAPTPTEEPR